MMMGQFGVELDQHGALMGQLQAEMGLSRVQTGKYRGHIDQLQVPMIQLETQLWAQMDQILAHQAIFWDEMDKIGVKWANLGLKWVNLGLKCLLGIQMDKVEKS